MSTSLRVCVFVVGVCVSLGASWVLVQRLERVAKRLRFSEALLGMVAALAADAPEITTAITALVDRNRRIGAGVVLGSNAFNLAALLGVAALVAGTIVLHRRVVLMNGAVALWVAGVTTLAVFQVVTVDVALLGALLVLTPYLVLLGGGGTVIRRIRLPAGWAGWLAQAIGEEELELEAAIHPRRGGARDGVIAVLALAVVVGASVAMEHSAVALGHEWALAPILVGGLVLAAVTSLPNAVAGIYLAARGRGAATLSTALNSNVLNAVCGLLIPASFLGLGSPSSETRLVALAYGVLTGLALICAYLDSGLRRVAGTAIIIAYAGFTAALIAGA
jgi:cation:H+ antiporter